MKINPTLTQLFGFCSPSGHEAGIHLWLKKQLTELVDCVSVDVQGNLIAALNPDAELRVMLCAHGDQLGFMVRHIEDDGRVLISAIGDINPHVVPGSDVIILSRAGSIPAVLSCHPYHLFSRTESPLDLTQIWMDVGAQSKKVAEKLAPVGSYVGYRPRISSLGANRICGVGCDNKVGLFILIELAKVLRPLIKKIRKIALFLVSSSQEELDMRGSITASFSINPHIGIAIDATHASDVPGFDVKHFGEISLGKGPVLARGPVANQKVEEIIDRTARRANLPLQYRPANTATWTDANTIQVSRSGVATGLIGIPTRFMHSTCEVVDWRDLHNTVKLLATVLPELRHY